MRAGFVVVVAFVLAACGADKNHQLPDGGTTADASGGGGSGSGSDAPPVAHIRVAPDDVTVTIIDKNATTQAYTATLVQPDGAESDVTSQVTWSLASASYGTFTGSTLSITGGGAGPTRVQATLDTAFGDAGLTVYVRGVRLEGSLPTDPDLPTLFGSASEDPTRAPAIAYPSDGILVPPNLGQFDVHWSDASVNDVWEVTMSNQYIDLRIYTQGLDPNARNYTLFNPEEWYPIASTKQQLSLSVAGLQLSAPSTKGTSVVQHVDVTNEDSRGGIYYWSTTTGGIQRYDVGKPDVPPAPMFGSVSGDPGGCMGCHSLSRNGTRIAVTNYGGGPNAVYDVATHTQLMTPDQGWDFSTFTHDGSKVIGLENGTMTLYDVNAGGTNLGSATNSDSMLADHPDLSPDDTMLANVESTESYDLESYHSAIVVRTFDSASNTFGLPTVLVAGDETNNINNYYPSFSPDGQWIAYSRVTDGNSSYNATSATVWVVKADGTQDPIPLTIANSTGALTNSWPRWVPFAQSFGASNETLFYLTFSSERPFGVRIPGGGRPQIWMTPFFPAKALLGQDPSGPMFRVPFQDVNTANHIAQWTDQVVSSDHR